MPATTTPPRAGPDGSDRAVSEIIGFILIVAILVVSLSLVQVYAVPAQNEEIEFKHSQAVRTDLVEARNAILESKRTGQNVPVTIELAPQYPSRLFTINPAPPSGTLRSTENGTITVSRPNGQVVSVCPITDQTRMIEYEPNYNEYAAAPTVRFENTVVYEEYAENRTRLLSGQSLIEGRTINLVPVLESFSHSGSEGYVFEPRPGQLEETRVVDPILTVPTRLPEETWEELLASQVDASAVSVTDGVLRVETTGAYVISCGPVAINQQPPGGTRTAAGSDINPAEPGDVILESALAGIGQEQDTVYVTFNNTASDPINVTAARLSFYFQDGQKTIDTADIYDDSTGDLLGTVTELGPTVSFTSPVRFDALATHRLSFVFNDNPSRGDFFVLRLTYDTGSSGTYFIGVGDQGTVGPTPTPTPTPSGNQPPTADFTSTTSGQGGNRQVSFDGSPSTDPDGSIVSYEWDVGNDGTYEYTGQTVTVQRVSPNTAVTLRVTDDDGATDTITRTV